MSMDWALAEARRADRRIVASRRVPRTASEMRARLNMSAGRACPDCGGAGGHIVTTSIGGVVRTTWTSCGRCRGTGATT